jgi:CRP-like cAMP-binding protein
MLSDCEKAMNPAIMTGDPLTILTELFAETEVDEETIEHIFEHAQVKDYPTGTILCREGRIEHTLYVLLRGHVDVYRSYGGSTHLLEQLKPGNCFGELALIMDVPRTADVAATEPVQVLELHRDDFNRFIKSKPVALLAIVRLVIQRMLSQDNRRLIQLARRAKSAGSVPRIFISYARQDESFVRRLATDLAKYKISTWVDFDDIESGRSWARQIGEALDSCELMLLILSPSAMESTNVEDEWNYYLDKGKMILPIMHKQCNIPYRLYKLQYMDFIEHDYADALSALVDDLRLYIGEGF